jgi:hypothetical protein
LTEHIDKLNFVAEFLLKNESMDEEQFKAAMEMDCPTIEDIEEIALKKKQKSDEENRTAHENNAKAEEEERLRREELAKKMSSGEELSEDVLREIFETRFTAKSADDDEAPKTETADSEDGDSSLEEENKASDEESSDESSENK